MKKKSLRKRKEWNERKKERKKERIVRKKKENKINIREK